MAFTIATNFRLAGVAAMAGLLPIASFAISPGLPTRDQNPMLQAYYLPSFAMPKNSGWHLSHSLFITNTFQTETKGNENLTIDVENYRYDFSLAYQTAQWRVSTTIPFIDNRGGQLDQTIENWHDFFGLPEGGRNNNPDDQINLSYTRDGETVFLQNGADSGIGDIAVNLSYRFSNQSDINSEFNIGLELPTGSIESNSGNETTDLALWLSSANQLSDDNRIYGLFGVAIPGKGGQLENELVDHIWLAQIGSELDFTSHISGIMQFDYHSEVIKSTRLKAFGDSLQIQLALQFKNWLDDYHVDLFFSEDIVAKTAPDITFGLRLSRTGFD